MDPALSIPGPHIHTSQPIHRQLFGRPPFQELAKNLSACEWFSAYGKLNKSLLNSEHRCWVLLSLLYITEQLYMSLVYPHGL